MKVAFASAPNYLIDRQAAIIRGVEATPGAGVLRSPPPSQCW